MRGKGQFCTSSDGHRLVRVRLAWKLGGGSSDPTERSDQSKNLCNSEADKILYSVCRSENLNPMREAASKPRSIAREGSSEDINVSRYSKAGESEPAEI